MASGKTIVNHLIEQMGEAGSIRGRAMFGEFGIYCDDQFVAMICDDQLFVKSSTAASEFLDDSHLAPPYPGAKNAYLVPSERIDDREWLGRFVRATATALASAPPKPRTRKRKPAS